MPGRKGAGGCTQHMTPSAGLPQHDPNTANSFARRRQIGRQGRQQRQGGTGRARPVRPPRERDGRRTQQVAPFRRERTQRKRGRGHVEAVKCYGAVQTWNTHAHKQHMLFVMPPVLSCFLRPGSRFKARTGRRNRRWQKPHADSTAVSPHPVKRPLARCDDHTDMIGCTIRVRRLLKDSAREPQAKNRPLGFGERTAPRYC